MRECATARDHGRWRPPQEVGHSLMTGRMGLAIIVAGLGLAGSGCMNSPAPRYVYQDGEYGVVALPQNTSRWPTYYRERAEELMARHFPEGYEIVRAEEVAQGKRSLSIGKTTEAELDPGVLVPAANNYIKIGKLDSIATRKREDQVQIIEARIIDKRKTGVPATQGYSTIASLSPPTYLDPNMAARLDDAQLRAEKEKLASE